MKSFLSSNHDWVKVQKITRSYLKVPFFLHFSPLLKVGLASLLSKKMNQYPVVYDMQMKVYREKDLVSNSRNIRTKDLKSTENGRSKASLLFMFFLR